MSGKKCNASTLDMVGKQISFLTVLGYVSINDNDRGAHWLCRCICGKELVKRGNTLRHPDKRNKTGILSCGCRNPKTIKHGLSSTKEYHMWEAAKVRAKARNLAFDLVPTDIVVPNVCPVLGLELKSNTVTKPNSPTLDRIDSSKGYTKGNVRVISHRANTLKNDATIEELTKVLEDAIKLSGN